MPAYTSPISSIVYYTLDIDNSYITALDSSRTELQSALGQIKTLSAHTADVSLNDIERFITGVDSLLSFSPSSTFDTIVSDLPPNSFTERLATSARSAANIEQTLRNLLVGIEGISIRLRGLQNTEIGEDTGVGSAEPITSFGRTFSAVSGDERVAEFGAVYGLLEQITDINLNLQRISDDAFGYIRDLQTLTERETSNISNLLRLIENVEAGSEVPYFDSDVAGLATGIEIEYRDGSIYRWEENVIGTAAINTMIQLAEANSGLGSWMYYNVRFAYS